MLTYAFPAATDPGAPLAPPVRFTPGADLPPTLLTKAGFHGTLAATRSLGRAGIRVTVADPSWFSPAARSKYATQRVDAPDVRDVDAFLAWLERFATSHGTRVLLPTNDDTAWLFARHRERLARAFLLAPTTIDQVHSVLNKRLLHQLAASVGLDAPRTWYPQSEAEVRRCASEATFPVVVKPTTQVLFVSQSKGIRVESAGALEASFQRLASHPYKQTLLDFDPTVRWPLVQEFYPSAADGIYNISGFAYRKRLCGVRAARKILQQPRGLGTGVCFVAADVLPGLVAGLERLVAAIGFEGVFEAEFIESERGPVLIDFNPRFYNQLAFDVARGLPLPLLAYHHATGDHAALQSLIDTIPDAASVPDSVYVDSLALRMLVAAQKLSGALSADEARHWTRWYRDNRQRCVQAVVDADDPWPAYFDAASMAMRHGRHPIGFFRTIVMNRQ